MRKIVILLFFIIFFLFPHQIFAQEPNFDISISSNYEVKNDRLTRLTQNVSIKNKTDYYFTPTYSISVGFKNIQNIVAFGENGPIPFTLDEADPENKNIKLTFEKRYAGLGVSNNFTLRLDTTDIASKRGNIWEVSIPGVSSPDDFASYNTTVSTPQDFGIPKIVKPQKEFTSPGKVAFNKNEIGQSGIYMLYGDNQYYSFELSYHISNPNLFPVKTEIALPPKTNYQNVLITSFSQKPTDVSLDKDNNWIAQYSLFPQQRLSVVVKGLVEVLEAPEKEELSSEQIKSLTKPGKYWESNAQTVKKASESLKTPQDVYRYVIENLSYNFAKVTGDNKRLGALNSLKNPKNSVCLEFTDLFVALARASGIPARAVEGYAFTNNSSLRPLSLLEDVLHSWPEYYDFDSKKWIMVDPTWGNTTKGLDYFNTLDFEHIAFVIKGEDSTYPIPAGGYKFDRKSKDVLIKFAKKADFEINEKIEITDDFPSFVFPGLSLTGSFKIRNTGNSFITNKTAIITGIDGEKKAYIISDLPPGGLKSINLNFEKTPFLTNQKKSLKIQIDKFSHTKKVTISFIPDLNFLLLFGGIISGSITIAIITYHTGSVLIQRHKRKDTLRGKSKRH